MQEGTTTLLNLADYFRANNMKYTEMKFPNLEEVVKAYESGKSDTITSDVSQLYALRLYLIQPSDHVILPDVISKEPLAPVVRRRDVRLDDAREVNAVRDDQCRRTRYHL